MHFIVAFDGSESATNTLRYAADLLPEATFTVVHAAAPELEVTPAVADGGGGIAAGNLLVADGIDATERRGRATLAEAMALGEELGIEVRTVLLYGDPVAEIADFAMDGGYDGIFVGHRGLGDRYQDAFGSVAKGLLARASLPVTVVK
ncbi:universal stress protein [Natronorarus salvus]|uniref:universal stress protein n=1 Tax=Natronorarus salvus TaxID=3117733 RepID=UPI002F262549